jgi:hypothetical protein
LDAPLAGWPPAPVQRKDVSSLEGASFFSGNPGARRVAVDEKSRATAR